MNICVDTTILIDILKDEYPEYQENLFIALKRKEYLIVPSVVSAELMPQFKGDTSLLRSFFNDFRIRIEPLDNESVINAGKHWMSYLKKKSKEKCPQCGYELIHKQHFLSDFYIGGFALTKCDMILTRDRGIYRSYFPELQGYENCLV